jgi:hypothetical protein
VDKKTRLATAFDLRLPDRAPILGGWLAAPGHVQALTGCTEADYWSDPTFWALHAERVLGSDGVIWLYEPASSHDWRIVDERVLAGRAQHTLDSILADINALPEPHEVRASFDEHTAYAQFVAHLKADQVRCGDIMWCPADWDMIPHWLWVHQFGHENALVLPALHPGAHRKLIRVEAERGRQRAALRARAIREGIHPRAILTGEDLCSQRGPMVSPAQLHRDYFPLLEYALEPLLAVGARVVWHCDGDVRPILHDVLACGVAGLQGFQAECGMALEWIVNLRTRRGDPLLIFGPLSVTTTLPFGTPERVRAEVRQAIHLCRDKASLVFFTSNTINPDIPLDNVLAFWDEVITSHW